MVKHPLVVPVDRLHWLYPAIIICCESFVVCLMDCVGSIRPCLQLHTCFTIDGLHRFHLTLFTITYLFTFYGLHGFHSTLFVITYSLIVDGLHRFQRTLNFQMYIYMFFVQYHSAIFESHILLKKNINV